MKTAEAEYVSACTERHDANTRGHTWKREDFDPREVDIFGLESSCGYHNGPRCVVCGYGFCHHCHRDGPPEPCTGPKPKTEDEQRLVELYGEGF